MRHRMLSLRSRKERGLDYIVFWIDLLGGLFLIYCIGSWHIRDTISMICMFWLCRYFDDYTTLITGFKKPYS